MTSGLSTPDSQHPDEDFCRVEDKEVQQVLNMVRKTVLNSLKIYKGENSIKRPLSNIMLDCLINPDFLLAVFDGIG